MWISICCDLPISSCALSICLLEEKK
jgi:hypothetical protein